MGAAGALKCVGMFGWNKREDGGEVCREYNVALRLELARKEVKDDPNRTAELAAYFTHAKLQVGPL